MELEELRTHIHYIRDDLGDIKKRIEPLEKHVFFINTLFKVSLGLSSVAGVLVVILKFIKG